MGSDGQTERLKEILIVLFLYMIYSLVDEDDITDQEIYPSANCDLDEDLCSTLEQSLRMISIYGGGWI